MPDKLNNLDKTDKFLETQKLPKPTQKATENVNRPVTTKAIKSVIKHLLTPGVDPEVSHGHWVVVVYRRRFLDGNKGTASVRDAGQRCRDGGGGCGAGEI